ncbi:MAG: hypothetical protein ACI9MR_005192, partial [Myxococcota bacterium]
GGGVAGVMGCTDVTANNYDATATQDDSSCMYDVTFSVDMACSDDSGTGVVALTAAVSVTGPFCSWCSTGYELADADGDDVWEGTFSFPAGALEFKYMANGFAIQEDLIGAGACAVVTDGVNFANRQITVDAPATLDDTWGQCTACGVTVLTQVDLPVTFDDATVDYMLVPFEGAAAAIVVDPTDATNMVVESSKNDGAQIWAGVTAGDGPGLATPIPFVTGNRKLNIRVWVPVANTTIRVKVEEAATPQKSVETETVATMAGAWQTLTFDFDNEVSGTAAFNDTYAYNQVSIFMGFGTNGTDDGAAVYYFDDIQFGAGGPVVMGCTDVAANNYNAAANQDDGSCTFDPTAPTMGPTAPAFADADVISLFSDTYTDATVDTWSTGWSSAVLTDVDLNGNAVKQYASFPFVGIEFTSMPVDATLAAAFHMDVWTPATSGAFKVKLVDFGVNGTFEPQADNSESELTFTVGTGMEIEPGTWTRLTMPMSSFTGLASREHLAQLVLSGDPSVVFIDNVFFELD